jgi:ATP-dependent DNA helicase RecQ
MRGAQKPPATLADLVPRHTARYASRGGRAVRAVVEDVGQLDGEAAIRFERLRSMRTKLAREKSVPPYVICHDSTLKLIAARAPADVMELGRIKGMGPAKVSQYGDAILAALRGGEE